jgi:hypothetical protein
MGATSPARRSYNDMTGWNRSSIPFPVSKLAVTSRIVESIYRLAKEKGLEGIIAKRKSSIYRPGKRSPDWLKIKSRPQQEFIVCGFTEGKGSRKHFGALLLGAYRNGKLRYFGHSGTGFSEKGLKEAIERLKGVACRAPLRHFSVSAFVGRVIAVGMNPGQTAFTLIRRGPKVTANWSVKLTTAAFEALWEEW